MNSNTFETWLIEHDNKKQSSAYSYKMAISKIETHYAEQIGESVDFYTISIDQLKNIKKLYSQEGNYSEFGERSNATHRNALNALYRYRNQSFKTFIEQLSITQLENWFKATSQKDIPEHAIKENWKYNLAHPEHDKSFPFKWAIRDMATQNNIPVPNFSSNLSNRNMVCERFNVYIKEDLVYDQTQANAFKKYYEKHINNTELFQLCIDYANEFSKDIIYDPYDVRIAISNDKRVMYIMGMRNVYGYHENNNQTVINCMVDSHVAKQFETSSIYSKTYDYGGDDNKVNLYLKVSNWNDIPKNVLDNHYNCLKEEYNKVLNSSRRRWNEDANTTNDALKTIIFEDWNVQHWLDQEFKNNNMHQIPFFTESEFQLLNQTKGKRKTDTPEDEADYQQLQKAYKKVQYWMNEIKNDIFPEGFATIRKRPTSQANKFDGYLWCKIYPTKEDKNNKWLAITIGLGDNFHYHVKIDTIGLGDKNPLRQAYENYRGDFFNSKIVFRYHHKDILDWEQLFKQSKKDIQALLPHYNELKSMNSNTDKPYTINTKPLNQILYGPPGTGKTYATKEMAVSIIDNNFIKDLDADLAHKERRKRIAEKYETLCSQGQIVFTTFHQSMGYEDFVEGIKPIPPVTENSTINYKVENGIFKALCERTKEVKESDNFDEAYSKFVNDVLELGFIELKSLIRKKPFNVKINSNETAVAIPQTEVATEMSITKDMLKDYIVNEHIRDFKTYTTAIGDYIKDNYNVSVKQVNNRLKNYVIIIDEINRGNVSAIFGELITLLEPDKRIGNNEEIRISLPYSKEPNFGVPSNLYIIGTMNTADRSVEALDTALRRRFEFKEMMPDYKVIKHEEVEGIQLAKVLKIINKRIELLIDRDHTIGHSYFVGVNTTKKLAKAFNNKIVPLLQEYFYGDYGKIGLVLGNGFVEKLKNNDIDFAAFDYDNANDFKTPTFQLKKQNSNSILSAVQILLGGTQEQDL